MREFIPEKEGKGDREQLIYFIRFTSDFLSEVISDEKTKDQHVILKELYNPFAKAIPEIKLYAERLIESIHKLSDNAIYDHGLTGNQLSLKFSIIKYRYEKFLSSRTGKLLRKLLYAIDTLLDSVIDATGVGGAVKEFKDALANATLE